MRTLRTFLVLAFILAGIAQPLEAIEVYQWTDENGVVHFSQWAPEALQDNLETVQVEGGQGAENGLGISEKDDPEGYRAHREQMDALWAEREARREAERERRAQASRTEYVFVQPENNYAYQYPYIFPGHGHRPPHRPGRPDKPVPLPIVEPDPPATATWKRP